MTYGGDRPHDDSVYRTLRTVGDAWSWLIMRDVLLLGARRFDDLQRETGAARATLASRLEQLVEGGVLERSAGRGYAPTAAGEDFLACLLTAWRWGVSWYPDRARAAPTHLACGASLAPVLRCAGCGQIVDARDVSWSSRRPVQAPPASSRRRAPRRELLERARPSPIARTLAVIGDWWSSLVIREAFYGTRRFDDFEHRLAVAPNILASRLSRLTADGILERVPYQRRPLRHEYRLTGKGLDLYPVPLAMLDWGDRWPTPSTAPVTLTHKPCGKRLRPRLSCQACTEDLAMANINLAAAAV
jgi:DNA-binding HxlR family transcriptional regulator